MNLQDDDFELFGLEKQFAQDREELDACWKGLQRQAHPDKFAAQGAAAQRIAMQWSVRINEAYQRLKDPIKRAAYLCELAGHPVNAQTNTAMPTAFLMQQMEWRETLDEVRNDPAGLDQLYIQVEKTRKDVLQDVEVAIDDQQNFELAAQKLRALLFIDKFSIELEEAISA